MNEEQYLSSEEVDGAKEEVEDYDEEDEEDESGAGVKDAEEEEELRDADGNNIL